MTKRKIQDSFVSGLMILAPLIVTVLVLKLLFDWSLILINPIVRGAQLTNYTGQVEILAQVAAGALVMIGILVVGIISRSSRGKAFLADLGRIPSFIPVFRTIYFTVKEISTSFSDRDSRFKRAVKLEYPREGFHSIGFVTGEAPSEIQEKAGDKLYNVYIPHSPNPTVGELKMLPETEIDDLDMSVKKALKLVMTSGISGSEK
jgi:uncharacterized membrane protein